MDVYGTDFTGCIQSSRLRLASFSFGNNVVIVMSDYLLIDRTRSMPFAIFFNVFSGEIVVLGMSETERHTVM